MPETPAERLARLRSSTRRDSPQLSLPASPQSGAAPGSPASASSDAPDPWLLDLLQGFIKQGGERAVSLGGKVSKLPVPTLVPGMQGKTVGDVTDASFGTSSRDIFNKPPTANFPELSRNSNAEDLGAMMEKIAEFFLPGNAGRNAGSRAAVSLIPDSFAGSPQTLKLLNALLGRGGQVAGDAATTGAIAASQGESDPSLEMGTSAGLNLAGMSLEALVPKLVHLAKTPMGKDILPIMLGGATYKALSALDPIGSLGAGMGAYGLGRRYGAKMVNNPALTRTVRKSLAVGGREASRAVPAIETQMSVSRRKLED